jgi:excisionase family DNA binding protein
MEPLLLKPDEAARVLGISRAMVYALARKGVLPTVNLGSSMKFSAEALREWVAEQVRANNQDKGAERK